jgi:hypothetical protein
MGARDDVDITIPKTAEEFRDHVVASLATLHTGQTQVLGQLTRMNGTQTQLIERMTEVEKLQAVHPYACPNNQRIGTLESTIATHIIEKNTKDQVDLSWWSRLKPYIQILIMAALLLLLLHANTLLEKL